jgi:hypothetical protein
VAVALGRTKTVRRQRTGSRPDAAKDQQQAAEPDKELESYLAALSPEEDVETTGTGRQFGSSQVYQLRLPLMANERLKELAARRGTSPGALAREWVMQHLEQETPGNPSPSPSWPQQEAQQQRPPTHSKPQPYPDQQYSGDLHAWPNGGYPGHQPGRDNEETDTEITIPRGGQYYR